MDRLGSGGAWVLVAVIGGCGSSAGDSESSAAGDTSGSDGTVSSSPTSPSSTDPSSTGVDPSAGSSTESSGADSSSTGDEPVDPPDCGALEGLPSAPGPHVAQIEALADDEWLALGPPAADPDYGVARGRSWGGRALVLAPELRGAFFTGEGVHAYVKPDGRGMDDVFFYDINAHAWIAIYPGTNTQTFNQQVLDGELSIDENGQLADQWGNPVPVHVLIHAWDFLTYDTVTRRFAFVAGDGMGRYYMPGLDDIDEGLSILEEMRDAVEVPPMSPWFYSTTDCRWERSPVEAPPADIGGFAAFMYASASDQYVYAGSQGVTIYDRDSNAWTTVQDSGPRPTGYDHGVAYDDTRNRLYMGSGDGTDSGVFIYDIAAETWTKPASSGPGPGTFRTNGASIFYDGVNDVVTVFQYNDGVQYTYAPSDDAWTSRPLPTELLNAISYPAFNAFYDPEYNAYFVYAASDSTDNGTMFAYRYDAP